jgi:hypothetical protein
MRRYGIIERSLATIEAEQRRICIARRNAWRPELPLIPLHHQMNVWAIRKGPAFHERMQGGHARLGY